MAIVESLPITTLITKLAATTDSNSISFTDLKQELSKLDGNGTSYYHVSLKENDDLCILYYNDLPSSTTSTGPETEGAASVPSSIQEVNPDDDRVAIANSSRSYIFEKSSLKPIASQGNRIIYNAEANTILASTDFSKVVVQQCFEGTMILVFYHGSRWYVSTRRCLDAGDSVWVRNKSYLDMFNEAIQGKFTLDDLNNDLCYHFVLIHHRNKNIVTYDGLSQDYKEIFHILTTEKYTLNEVPNHTINPSVRTVPEDHFSSISDLYNSLKTINDEMESSKKITIEGYILRVYQGEPYKSPFSILKLQTDIYQKLMKMKPNNSNINQSYLELYQKDKLVEFLPYFSKYNADILKRIHLSMKNLAKEMLDLYHCTRKKNNAGLYSSLSDTYKKVLYGLHGLYIEHRKLDFSKDIVANSPLSRSINVHDVYHYLKGQLQPFELRQLFLERSKLIEDPNCKTKYVFLNRNCIYTMTQFTLMFKDNVKGPTVATVLKA